MNPVAASLRVDLDALAANFHTIAAEAAGAQVCPVVKADGYGLGAAQLSQRLYAEGARAFFVARLSEGGVLRAALPQPDAVIHVLDGAPAGSESRLLAARLSPVLSSLDQARAWTGLVGLDLAKDASCLQPFEWNEGLWSWEEGYEAPKDTKFDVVVIDYGVKRNILRSLASIGAKVTVVPAKTSAEDVLARKPDGVLLSNGPGDPEATGAYAEPEIRKIVDALYQKHVKTVEQVGGISNAEFATLNKSLHRLERVWTDQILYRL